MNPLDRAPNKQETRFSDRESAIDFAAIVKANLAAAKPRVCPSLPDHRNTNNGGMYSVWCSPRHLGDVIALQPLVKAAHGRMVKPRDSVVWQPASAE